VSEQDETDSDQDTPEVAPAVPDPVLVKRGSIRDYVSLKMVPATPEELEAVQVMSRRLVEDFGYPKEHLRTRPQWRVGTSPSASKKYPVDIVVFSSEQHVPENVLMIVECKRRVRKDGIDQLYRYLDMSAAHIGVWFNGEDHQYVRKILHTDGTRTFEVLPNIPRFGQRIEDIGLHRKKDLVPASNLRAVFRDIRNHLAGNAPGITRDEPLAQEVINLLFCKIFDEIVSAPRDMVNFRWGLNEEPRKVHKRILDLYDKVKIEYPDVFDENDKIDLDPDSVAYVVGELQTYSLLQADRDAIGEAFEVFISPALRGAEGQFFTPRNVARGLVEMVDPKPGEMIIDPACGSGGFLTVALEHVWRGLEAEGEAKAWSATLLERRKREVASRTLRGLDKDAFLARCTKAYLAILGDGRGGVFRVDSSLQPTEDWPAYVQEKVKLGTFDVVITNPPFGKKIRITGRPTLEQYDLGHVWATNKGSGEKERTDTVQKDQAPQLLFVERCLQLLKPGGRLGIILPESLFGSPSYEHIVRWFDQQAAILAVAAMPEPLFKTSGKTGTHTKVCMVVMQKRPVPAAEELIFMADAKWCGHDSRGNPTLRKDGDTEVLLDDVPTVAQNYVAFKNSGLVPEDHLGFMQPRSALLGMVLVPRYYDPELAAHIEALKATHEMPAIGEFIESGAIAITTGIEVGKMAYGTGPVPFIRTSDLSNWELKADPKHGVSSELHEALKKSHPDKFDVQAGDILMVRDGTYLVGTSAVISSLDTEILYQSHVMKIRVNNPTAVDPWLLFAALNSPIAKRQIRAKRFTQDIIDSLGNRLAEVRVPIPRDLAVRRRISGGVQAAVQRRAELRETTRLLTLEVEGVDAGEDDLAMLDEAT
jgi:type I restriction enzyme M protein